MSLAYFPLYADRYEADTTHLSMLEDGAYNRLLRLCWRTPGCKLPNDLAWIYRQTRATSAEDQAAIRTILAEFFTKGRGKVWSRKLLEVHVQVSVAHSAKSEAGKKGAAAKALKNNKTDESTAKAQLEHSLSNQNQNQNQNQTVREEGGGGSREADFQNGDLKEVSDRILTAMGVDPTTGRTTPRGKRLGGVEDHATIQRWISAGLTPNEIVAVVADCVATAQAPPNSFKYFDKAMARLIDAKEAPPPTTAPKGRTNASASSSDRLGPVIATALAKSKPVK